MNSAGNNKKTGYLVMALFLVGLTAYSDAMKDLAEIQQLALSAGQVIAQWSSAPAEIPQLPPAVLTVETCQSKQPTPPLELPWLDNVQENTEPSAGAPGRPQQNKELRVRVKPSTDEIATKVKKLQRFELDAADFEVRISKDQFPEASEPFTFELPTMLKLKARKHNTIKMNPRDREMLLKTLNRSINLRIAS